MDSEKKLAYIDSERVNLQGPRGDVCSEHPVEELPHRDQKKEVA